MFNIRPAAESLRAVFNPQHLEKLAREHAWVKRRRETQGPAVLTSLLRSLGSASTQTLAELHRNFNAHNGSDVDYKAFHRRLAHSGFPLAAHALLETAMTELSLTAIASLENGPFERFDDILIHDGTSFAVHPDLQELFPGRFNKNNPAAVELHITMSLFTENMVRVTLAPDVDSERKYMPEAQDVRNKLLLMDRGYDGRQDLQEIHDAGGFFAVRIRSLHKPRVITVHTETRNEKRRKQRMEGQKLDIALQNAPKNAIIDLDVCWENRGELTNFARLVCIYNAAAKHWVRVLTNLDRESFSAADILTVYKLRWQIELLNKELKSNANLRRFCVRDANTMEGLIWCSLCAALLKRFIAQVAQLSGTAEAIISTQRVAKCGAQILELLSLQLLRSSALLIKTMSSVVAFLCRNARRANPRRDGLAGRFKLGLAGVFAPQEAV